METTLKQDIAAFKELIQKLPDKNEWITKGDTYWEMKTKTGMVISRGLMDTPEFAIAYTQVIMAPVEFELHTHKGLESITLLEGDLKIYTDTEQTMLVGQSIQIRPNKLHRAYSQNGCKFIAIMIPNTYEYPTPPG